MKTIFQRAAALLLVLVIVISALPTASASVTGTVTRSDKVDPELYFWGDTVRSYNFTYADGTSATASIGGFCLHYVDGGIAYCIEPQLQTTTNTQYNGEVLDSSVYWTTKLTSAQRHAISLILLYGAPNGLYSDNKYAMFGFEGATQILIWEIVMGLRNPTAPFTRTSDRLYNTFAGNTTFPLDTAYSHIVNKLQKHGIVPSFASTQQSNAPEIVMHYNSTTGLCGVSVTDTNGVLADDFDFSASGVSFTKTGNTLTISAPYSVICSGNVIASAAGRSLAENNLGAMIWTCPSKQTLIKTVNTSSDPVRAYFKLVPDAAPGTMTMQKTSDSVDVVNYCFKIYEWTTGRTWYGKSDSDGRIYRANAVYVQIGSTKKYTFTDMIDGKYTFLEVLSQKGDGVVFPDSWRIKITNQGTTVYDHTFTGSDLTKDANGDCRLDQIELTGLTGGGVMEMTIHNKTLTAPLEIIKRSDDNNVASISFTVEQDVPGIGYVRLGTYLTNANGYITIPNLTIGTELRVTESVPDGYTSEQETQEIVIAAGTNTLTFVNHKNPVTSSLTIRKTSDDGNIAGISFTVEQDVTGIGYVRLGTYQTNANGYITIPDLIVGTKLRVTEIVPDGYTCEQESQEIVIADGENTLTFVNTKDVVPPKLTIRKVSDNGTVSGFTFVIRNSSNQEVTRGMTNRGGVLIIGSSYLTIGETYTVVELAKAGYVCQNNNQQITIEEGENTLTFNNKLIRGGLKILKVDSQTEEPLPGAGFKVCIDGKTVAEGYTGPDGTVQFDDLPYGDRYYYQEFEAPEGYLLDDTMYPFSIRTDGKIITVTRRNAQEQPEIGSIQIYKVNEAGTALADVTFLLEYSLDDGETWQAVQFREENSAVTEGGCTSDNLEDGTLTTDDHGIVCFAGLCRSDTIKYRLTETETAAGYELLASPAFEDYLPANGEADISLTVVNASAFTMPATGGTGFIGQAVGLGLAATALAALFITTRKKKNKNSTEN
ncbi:MAG: Cys-Gln thioester bond-forming surface protein [Oscillospiraceae bacterium]|nr:Cys-Gln thioester bond-forming surface protein [Oscillospiraceae bacterium]